MKVAVANNPVNVPKSKTQSNGSQYSNEGKISTPVYRVKEHNGGRFLLNRDFISKDEFVDTYVNYIIDEEVPEETLGHVKLFVTSHDDVSEDGEISMEKLGLTCGKGRIRTYHKNGQEHRMISGSMSCWNFAIFPARSDKNPDLIASFVLSNKQPTTGGQRSNSNQQQESAPASRPQQDNDIPF